MPTTAQRIQSKFRKENGLAWCSKCKQNKPQSEFEPCPGRRPFGLASHCDHCNSERKLNLAKNKYWSISESDRYIFNRKSNLKRKFGISLSEYQDMLDKQDGVCAICKRPESKIHHFSNQIQPLVVDHDHKTGKIRGLLCTNCNKGIGLLEDNDQFLINAANYVSKL